MPPAQRAEAPDISGPNWLDRAIGLVDPERQLARMQARVALNVLNQHYDAAGASRRTAGWKRPGGDPNAVAGLPLQNLRNSSRHLIRNNGHAVSVLQTIVDDCVGAGIKPTTSHSLFQEWSESTDIDADGRCDLYGLEHLVTRTTVEAGECVIRRRWRRPSDGFALPMQLQVLEPDHIDTSQHRNLENGGKIVRGIEYNAIGRRTAYWLFREHPGSSTLGGNIRLISKSAPVPASEIAHVFRLERPGQVRGIPWLAPVLLRFSQFDELADATLMKQLIAACFSVFVQDVTGSAPYTGAKDADEPTYDRLEPGMIEYLQAGQSVQFADPPTVREYGDYANVTLREIASGAGVTPEDMTGDYGEMSFSAARMSRLRHWSRVEGWRWRMLKPQFLNPVWRWAMQGAALMGEEAPAMTTWTAPPLPFIEPDKEGLAHMRNIRAGITTLDEVLRERGFTPDAILDEAQARFEDLTRRGLIFDSDPRVMTQVGQLHSSMSGGADSEAAAWIAANPELAESIAAAPPDVLQAMVEAGNNGGSSA